jgi:hypothetical protein
MESSALLATLAAAVLDRRQHRASFAELCAAACLAAMIAIWARQIQPINRQVNSRSAESIPGDWPEKRTAWLGKPDRPRLWRLRGNLQ